MRRIPVLVVLMLILVTSTSAFADWGMSAQVNSKPDAQMTFTDFTIELTDLQFASTPTYWWYWGEQSVNPPDVSGWSASMNAGNDFATISGPAVTLEKGASGFDYLATILSFTGDKSAISDNAAVDFKTYDGSTLLAWTKVTWNDDGSWNVEKESVVPEPSSLLVLMTGAGGLLTLIRRRRA